MFRGAAWFSPSVPRHVRRQWVRYGGKKAGRGRDGIRRRLWYCFCNGPEDPKLADVKARGLVAYHALWVLESVKLGRALPMGDYILDEPLKPGLDVVLQSPKRKPRSLTLDPSISSSPYTIRTESEDQDLSIRDLSFQDADMSIDHNIDLDGLLQTPSRLSDLRSDVDNSSFLSWDITPSLTFEFDEEEMENSRVEMLIDTEEMTDTQNFPEWSEMSSNISDLASQSSGQNSEITLPLDASAVFSRLSELYPHALAGSTRFIPRLEHDGRMFTAVRRRRSEKAQNV